MAPSLCWIAHRDPANPSAGGAEKSIQETCAGLTKLGWKTVLIAGGYRGSRSEEQVGTLRVIRGSGPATMHLEITHLLRLAGPVDVIVEDLGHVVPYGVERITHIPSVIFFRHLHRRTLPGQVSLGARVALDALERAYPLIYRRSPVVAPSQSALQDLRGLGFEASRLHQIGYGVNLRAFSPGVLTEQPSLVYFAGMRRYKRPQHALYLLKNLITDGVRANLFMAGSGPESGSLEKLSRSLGLEDNVTFTGRLSDAALSALISRSWIHVQTSVAEGWGLTVWEAAASGVPTVGYRVPGLIDSVSEGVTGILVADGDLAALTRAAESVIRNRRDWRARCLSEVCQRSWADVAADWDRLLRNSLGGG